MTLDETMTYDFVASDKTVIKLRRMSDRQRTRLFGFSIGAVHGMFQRFIAACNPQQDDAPSRESVQPLYDDFRNNLLSVIQDILVNPDDLKIMQDWDHPGDWVDLYGDNGIFGAIVAKEAPPATETVVPLPEAVEALTDEEVNRLGESSAPKPGAVATTRSRSRSATSSDGAESTKAEKPETSGTSPSPS